MQSPAWSATYWTDWIPLHPYHSSEANWAITLESNPCELPNAKSRINHLQSFLMVSRVITVNKTPPSGSTSGVYTQSRRDAYERHHFVGLPGVLSPTD